MRRFWRWLALIGGLVISTLALALFWIRNVDAWNPIPRWVWDQVERRVDLDCCEQAADVEYSVVLCASAVTMVLVTAASWSIAQALRKIRCRV